MHSSGKLKPSTTLQIQAFFDKSRLMALNRLETMPEYRSRRQLLISGFKSKKGTFCVGIRFIARKVFWSQCRILLFYMGLHVMQIDKLRNLSCPPVAKIYKFRNLVALRGAKINKFRNLVALQGQEFT